MPDGEYGVLGGLVGLGGSLVAATAAIALGWRGRAEWEPSEQDLPAGSRKLGGLLSAIAIAVLWFCTRPAVALLDGYSLAPFSITMGVVCFLALIAYGFFIAVYTYKVAANGHGSRKIIGGFWLTKQAKSLLARNKRIETIQRLLDQRHGEIDRVWTRASRALTKQAFVAIYIALTVSGTTALASSALLMEASSTQREHATDNARLVAALSGENADLREEVRVEIRRLLKGSTALDASKSTAEVRRWLERSYSLTIDPPRHVQLDAIDLSATLLWQVDALWTSLRELNRWRGSATARARAPGPIPKHPRCKTFPPDLFENSQNYDDTIVIGAMFQNFNNEYLERAVEMAAAQLNRIGGIQGRRVAVVSGSTNEEAGLDSLTPDEAAQELARYFSDVLNLPVIIGPESSGRAEAAYNALVGSGVLLISPGATSDALTILDRERLRGRLPGLLWRTIGPDSYQAEALADLIASDPTRSTVAIAFQDGSYGAGLVASLSGLLRGRRQVSAFSFRGQFQRTEAVEKVLDHSLDETHVIMISSAAEDYRVFLSSVRSAIDNDRGGELSILVPDAGRIRALFRQLPTSDPIAGRILGTLPIARPSEHFEWFEKEYEGLFASADPPTTVADSPYTAHAYDAAWLAFYGIVYSLAHSDLSDSPVAAGLRRLSCQSCLPILVGPRDWAVAIEEIVGDKDINLQGVSGSLDYDPETEETESTILVWGLENRDGIWDLADKGYWEHGVGLRP